jgi:hypothetical protein
MSLRPSTYDCDYHVDIGDIERIAGHTSVIGFGVFLAAPVPRVTPQT